MIKKLVGIYGIRNLRNGRIYVGKSTNGMKHRKIAKEFNVSRTIVTRINSGARYALGEEQL